MKQKLLIIALTAISVISNAQITNRSLTSFSKYDFIPGDQVVYYDNFDQQPIGELPAGWNTNGTGEVVTLGNIPGKWIRMHQPFTYLANNEKELSENYTVELDLIMQLKKIGYVENFNFSIGIFGSNGESSTGNNFLKRSLTEAGYHKYSAVVATLRSGRGSGNQGHSTIYLGSWKDNKEYFKSGEGKLTDNLEKYYGKPLHIAIQVQKERYRLWVNDTKAFDVPKGVATAYKMSQLVFDVYKWGRLLSDDDYQIYVSNIKVAQGLPDMRHKLVDEGKFTTTAILFDINEATIKPESGGVLKELAGVFTEYKDMKVKIVGHTDSDGSDAANLALSKTRAAAVKEALVSEFNIDAARIEADGKGETVPAADNKTKEGKAQNRRVEFIKL